MASLKSRWLLRCLKNHHSARKNRTTDPSTKLVKCRIVAQNSHLATLLYQPTSQICLLENCLNICERTFRISLDQAIITPSRVWSKMNAHLKANSIAHGLSAVKDSTSCPRMCQDPVHTAQLLNCAPRLSILDTLSHWVLKTPYWQLC